MANDAEDYIAAVADACEEAGLIVADYWSDDIDPRDGGIYLVTRKDADPDEDWRDTRFLGWTEERGWLFGEPDSHGLLRNILYIGGSALPDPATLAAEARKVMSGGLSPEKRRNKIDLVIYRDQEDDDGFEEELAVYRGEAATAAGTEG